MFAVFYKGIFIDWWLNRPEDIGWIDRTIAAKAWNPSDVKVYWFENPPKQAVHHFNDDFSVSILESKIVSVSVGTTEEPRYEDRTVWEETETRSSRLYYENGALVD